VNIFYGLDAIGQSGYSRTEVDDPNIALSDRISKDISMGAGIGFVVGVMIQISDNFLLASEIEPELLYSMSWDRNSDSSLSSVRSGYSLNMNSQLAKVSLIYRWEK
jgi:hypothetical protein